MRNNFKLDKIENGDFFRYPKKMSVIFYSNEDEVCIQVSKLLEYPESLFSLMYRWHNNDRIPVYYISGKDLYKIKFFYEAGYWYNPRSYDRMLDIIFEGEIIEDVCDYLGLPFTLRQYEFDLDYYDDLEDSREYIGRFELDEYYEEEYLEDSEDYPEMEDSDSDF